MRQLLYGNDGAKARRREGRKRGAGMGLGDRGVSNGRRGEGTPRWDEWRPWRVGHPNQATGARPQASIQDATGRRV